LTAPDARYGDDQPETDARRLWKDLRDLSDRLVQTIPMVAPSCPVLVSGEWGTGKSSVLKVAERKLSNRGHPTVWFGAWYHEGEGNLLPLLLRALWQATPGEYRRWWRKHHWWRLRRAGLAVAKRIPDLLVSGAAAWGPWGLLAELVPRPDFREQDPAQDLWTEFRRLLDKAWPYKRPIIIFIDDLDRCSPAAALALIDSLRLLLGNLDRRGRDDSGPNCRFVVSLDREVLAQAVSAKFQGLGSDHASRYLEKIFPISFQLPQPRDEAVLEFVQSFLGHGVKATGDDVRRQDILGLALADPVFANPRLMKRCIERFRMIERFESLAKPRGNGVVAHPDDHRELTLAKWIAAGERWPVLRQLLARRGDEYWRQVHQALQEGNGASLPPADARTLLENPDLKLWLQRELLGGKGTRLKEFRDADRRLRDWGM